MEALGKRRVARPGARHGVKFALDASPLSATPGGIARYTAELHRALKALYPEHSFELLPGNQRLWWSLRLPLKLRRDGFALFHGTDFSVPYLPLRPSVMTLHDLSPFRAEFAGAVSGRVRRRTPWLLRLNLATRIITPTEAVRREAISRFGLDPARIHATHLGVSVQPIRALRTELLLMVGAGARKNAALARDAAPKNVPLKIVDANVEEEELARLYSTARVLLIPSLYEGFGLPAIEAMACGTPVIASKDAALMEVCGGAALHVDVNDEAAWAEAIRSVLSQPELAERLSQAGRARAKEFTWERTARQTFAEYEEAIRAYGR